jgi:nitroreductase
MQFKELVAKTRSYRRFTQEPLAESTLLQLVDYARLSASPANRQALKFLLSCDASTNEKIFPALSWAAALKDWSGPSTEERPTAYIVLLLDTDQSKNAGQAPGIAAQSIVLGAAEQGIGACMIGSINREALMERLALSRRYEVVLIVALGKPAETVVIEGPGPAGEITYYRDEAGVHHVPKRPLNELIVKL